MNPIDKYNKRVDEVNSLVCVGLDSDFDKLPERFRVMENPQFEFNKWIIDQTHEYVSAYKPNSAFYEAKGDQGIKELKMTFDYIHEHHPTIFTILDAKRADIGNTNTGYVKFVFDWLGADAITLHPYLGEEALRPFLDRIDKASIILCKTSNDGSGEFQDLKVGEKTISHIVAENIVNSWNKNNNCMLVVGATYPEELKKIREIVGGISILTPGIGFQGGDIGEVLKNGLASNGKGLIMSSSRGIIFSDNPAEEAKILRDEINNKL